LRQGIENSTPDTRLRLDYARALATTGQHEKAKALLDELLSGEVFPGKHEAVDLRKSLGD
jgi:hypothetical protein